MPDLLELFNLTAQPPKPVSLGSERHLEIVFADMPGEIEDGGFCLCGLLPVPSVPLTEEERCSLCRAVEVLENKYADKTDIYAGNYAFATVSLARGPLTVYLAVLYLPGPADRRH